MAVTQRRTAQSPTLARQTWAATAAEPGVLAQAVAAYAVLLFIKLLVFVQTGLLSILALALHSLGDLIVSIFLLLTMLALRNTSPAVSARALGRAQSAAALVATVVMLSFISLRLAEGAVGYLLSPRQALYSTPELAFALILGSMLAGGVPIIRAFRASRPTSWRMLSGEAHVMGALNDELSLLVGLAGIVLLNHGVRVADAWAALLIAVLIAAHALGLIRAHVSLLLGGPASQACHAATLAVASVVPGVLAARVVDSEGYGDQLLRATLEITVAAGTPIEMATAIAAAVEERLSAELGGVSCLVIPVPTHRGQGDVMDDHLPAPAQGGSVT